MGVLCYCFFGGCVLIRMLDKFKECKVSWLSLDGFCVLMVGVFGFLSCYLVGLMVGMWLYGIFCVEEFWGVWEDNEDREKIFWLGEVYVWRLVVIFLVFWCLVWWGGLVGREVGRGVCLCGCERVEFIWFKWGGVLGVGKIVDM